MSVSSDASSPVSSVASSALFVEVLALLTVAAAVLVRIRLLNLPLDRDEGEYAYAAQRWLLGEMPFRDFWHVKLPGLYVIYMGVLRFIGSTSVAIHGMLLAVHLLTILLLYAWVRPRAGRAAAALTAAALAGLTLGRTVTGLSANCEHFILPCVLLGLLLLGQAPLRVPWLRTLAAGICFGLAILIKQHGAAFLLTAVWLLWQAGGRAALPRLLVFLAGAVVPWAAVTGLFAAAGAFESYWFWTVEYGRAYTGRIPWNVGLAALGLQLGFLWMDAGPLWLLAALGVLHAARKRSDPASVGLAGWLAAGALAVVPGLVFRGHYFILLLPGIAIAAGMILQERSDAGATIRRIKPVWLTMLLAAALAWPFLRDANLFFILPPDAASRALYADNPFPESAAIAHFLTEHARPDEPVGMLGSEPQILFLAHRRSASGFLYMYPLFEKHAHAEAFQRQWLAEMAKAQPRFLVEVGSDYSWLRRPESPGLIDAWRQIKMPTLYRRVGLFDIPAEGPATVVWGAAAENYLPRHPSWVAVWERRP